MAPTTTTQTARGRGNQTICRAGASAATCHCERTWQALPAVAGRRAALLTTRAQLSSSRSGTNSLCTARRGARLIPDRACALSASLTLSTTRTARAFGPMLASWNRWRHDTYKNHLEGEKQYLWNVGRSLLSSRPNLWPNMRCLDIQLAESVSPLWIWSIVSTKYKFAGAPSVDLCTVEIYLSVFTVFTVYSQ